MDNASYAEIAVGFLDAFGDDLRDRARNAELVRGIPRVVYDHGEGTTFPDNTGRMRSANMREFRAVFSLPNDAVEAGDRAVFVAAIKKASEELGRSLHRALLDEVGAAAAEVGNVVDMGGRPIDGNGICDLLERMDFSFDGQGRPIFPTVVLPEGQRDHMRALLEDRAVEVRINAILVKKWMARYSL